MTLMIWPAAAIIITALLALAASKAWRGWLDLRRFEIAAAREPGRDTPGPSPAVRIEMANLKERLRRLEAIAQGVDL